MGELVRMIEETRALRKFHHDQFRRGVKGASIEAAACAIRERALEDARRAIIAARPRQGSEG